MVPSGAKSDDVFFVLDPSGFYFPERLAIVHVSADTLILAVGWLVKRHHLLSRCEDLCC